VCVNGKAGKLNFQARASIRAMVNAAQISSKSPNFRRESRRLANRIADALGATAERLRGALRGRMKYFSPASRSRRRRILPGERSSPLNSSELIRLSFAVPSDPS